MTPLWVATTAPWVTVRTFPTPLTSTNSTPTWTRQ